MKIIHAVWFNLVGIIVTEDEISHDRKIRIGHVPPSGGVSEEDDARYIADHGSPVPAAFLEEIAKVARRES